MFDYSSFCQFSDLVEVKFFSIDRKQTNKSDLKWKENQFVHLHETAHYTE